MNEYNENRLEKDSLGEVFVPKTALYGAQTQRAIENFPISGLRLPRSMIFALGMIKGSAAKVNGQKGLIPDDVAHLIQKAAEGVMSGDFDQHFPVDIYQTGSGTSSNMNMNEVISHLSYQFNDKVTVHPNDHVNFGQSSNDVFPTAIRIASYHDASHKLLPALQHLHQSFQHLSEKHKNDVRTGRTHLMDAMPVTFGQIMKGYARQIELSQKRLESSLERVAELPLGGTAVGTGINTHPEFSQCTIMELAKLTGFPFVSAQDHFEAQSTMDALVELSSQIKNIAISVIKIINDFRWMNSGPNAGLGEIQLPAVQPGSSIMPGKVNPVIEESVAMVCAQVIGYDTAVSIGGMSGNFELNVMQPMIAFNILTSMELLSNAMRNFADRSLANVTIRKEHVNDLINKNPILVTALNPLIGYDLAAKIAKKAFVEQRSLKEVALEMSDLSEKELDEALNPEKLTKGGIIQ